MSNTFILNQEANVASTYINELRDVNIQTDRARFRRNLERIGELLSYELSKTLDYESVDITTPLGTSPSRRVKDELVVTTILRAGLPMYQGVLNVFDHADSGFVASYRSSSGTDEVEINMEYVASGNLDGKVVILADPMLATGKSLLLALEGLLKNGTPKHVHILAAISSQQGVDYVLENINVPSTLWIGAVDPEMNDKSYIIPGLGDAGDLCFGEKL
ncbi:uracil phosphoribosyltransferase [Flammeovirga yaeyamensis]|uniref:Uracil phosphoribosyltransferase n=1 Tax=Flammeovirga yaeyamensis TaxID=367791 RepID=A0AAX1N4N7_9BACT|nr:MULTISPECIES: uracil phosphoribosyltransferase [Flammeovirga]ANQ51225.1 uracil phosphoribosyltransferase [Flammeovirga sp. MY04]MBB3698281.1 uracil phosphoribosyltransferase [Flammeovirga yaeyamensis]NMF34365.1 uracil phosphoribosyltransferase [Flammeovirga yaeyamensis]QWG01346.1 uracil phosphoribosyltransferase [Flammeovirga yaeyamensis]